MLSQATLTLYKFATTSPISATCSRVKGFSPVQLLLGLTITDSVLISRGPNLVPGLLEVAVSTGTPTTQASSLAVSSSLEMGSLMKEAIPAGRGRSFWWVGRLKSLESNSQQSQEYSLSTWRLLRLRNFSVMPSQPRKTLWRNKKI